MKHSRAFFFAIFAIACGPLCAEVPPPFPRITHRVMTWVPPYAVARCLQCLENATAAVGPKDGLTHLGLQFWMPTPIGGIERPDPATQDETVRRFRDWGHAHGIRVLLCVYNGAKEWDWPLARAGFAEHPEAFASALIAEMKRLDLDGVDLDLEGKGHFESDREAYGRFVALLSARLHEEHKQFTLDTFASIWNAPNQTWWKELLPLVDGLTCMGYDETGARASEWRSYAAQISASGENAAKLMLGMPTDKKVWQGSPALEHLGWVLNDGRAGVALWDAQLPAEEWRSSEVWSLLAKIRGAP